MSHVEGFPHSPPRARPTSSSCSCRQEWRAGGPGNSHWVRIRNPYCPWHSQPLNPLAMASLATLLLAFPVAPFVGVVALRDIRRNGGRGSGVAWLAVLFGGFADLAMVVALVGLLVGIITGGLDG